jgi:enoyl-CoA hydratase
VIHQAPGVEQLRLARPEKRNALDVATCEQLMEALHPDPPPERRCYLLYGEGEAFCAGADLDQIRAEGGEGTFGRAAEALYRRVRDQPLPVVAWINGPAFGAGCILAMMCDIRLAAPAARMGIPATRLGIALHPEMVGRIAAEAGASVARLLLLSGRPLESPDLLRLGLAHERAETHDAALRWTTDLAAAAPLSVLAHRRALQGRIDAATEVVAQAATSRDLAEGLRASKEGRPPRFDGT